MPTADAAENAAHRRTLARHRNIANTCCKSARERAELLAPPFRNKAARSTAPENKHKHFMCTSHIKSKTTRKQTLHYTGCAAHNVAKSCCVRWNTRSLWKDMRDATCSGETLHKLLCRLLQQQHVYAKHAQSPHNRYRKHAPTRRSTCICTGWQGGKEL